MLDYMKFTATFDSNKSANIILLLLISFEILLVLTFALSYLIDFHPFIDRLFHLDREGTLPAAFSALQLFLIGVSFSILAVKAKRPYLNMSGFWLAIGIAFMFFAVDEWFALHERISANVQNIEWYPMFVTRHGSRHGAWIPIYLSAMLVALFLGRKKAIEMFRSYRHQTSIMMFGVAIFCVGAVGFEVIGYLYIRGTGYQDLYALQVAMEELFEMFGASIILYATLLLYGDVTSVKSRQHRISGKAIE